VDLFCTDKQVKVKTSGTQSKTLKQMQQRFVVKGWLICHWTLFLSGQFENRLNKYIRHYEGLSYDTEALHNSHQRAKRALSPHDRAVHLDFHAHGRSVKHKCSQLSSLILSVFYQILLICCWEFVPSSIHSRLPFPGIKRESCTKINAMESYEKCRSPLLCCIQCTLEMES